MKNINYLFLKDFNNIEFKKMKNLCCSCFDEKCEDIYYCDSCNRG